MAKIKAIIFDFDGLLVNTEELLGIAFDKFLKRKGKTMANEDHAVMMGRPAMVNMNYLKDKYGLEGTAEDLLAERRKISAEIFEGRIALMEGVEELLERMRGWNLKYAIASGGRREIILPSLKRFAIDGMFLAVVTADDLVNSGGKPDPEVFLIAAERLGVKPDECVVLEDAANGIEAAKAAGMKAIFVPDSRFSEINHEKADVVLKNLHGMTGDVLKALEEK